MVKRSLRARLALRGRIVARRIRRNRRLAVAGAIAAFGIFAVTLAKDSLQTLPALMGSKLLIMLEAGRAYASNASGITIFIALGVESIFALALVIVWPLTTPKEGPVKLEPSLHSFYASVQYGTILVLSVLAAHAIGGRCCAIALPTYESDLFWHALVIAFYCVVASLATHHESFRNALFRCLSEQKTGVTRTGGCELIDVLSGRGLVVLIAFVVHALSLVGSLIGITGGLQNSAFSFLLAGFVSVAATVTERALIPVLTSMFCITVAFVTLMAANDRPAVADDALALGQNCPSWLYFGMFAATLALAAAADVKRNRAKGGA